MAFVLIFDADNTLWDTNAVFQAAHIAMLEVFEQAQLLAHAPSQIAPLRAIDRALMQHYGRHEYDFKTLVAALAYHYLHGFSPDQAAAYAAAKGEAEFDATTRLLMQNAYEVHVRALAELPPLFPGVMEMLTHLHTSRASLPHLSVVMFSEGHPARLEQTIEAHCMRQVSYFNEIVMDRKSVDAFKRVGALGRQYLADAKTCDVTTIVVGDSIPRDIRYAKAAGFTTVYIPSQFQEWEIPQSAMDRPDFQIASLLELPPILASLGLDLRVQWLH
jgi:putative hydrolase of the HAD superfamily